MTRTQAPTGWGPALVPGDRDVLHNAHTEYGGRSDHKCGEQAAPAGLGDLPERLGMALDAHNEGLAISLDRLDHTVRRAAHHS